jgi:hypothetical protein
LEDSIFKNLREGFKVTLWEDPDCKDVGFVSEKDIFVGILPFILQPFFIFQEGESILLK